MRQDAPWKGLCPCSPRFSHNCCPRIPPSILHKAAVIQIPCQLSIRQRLVCQVFFSSALSSDPWVKSRTGSAFISMYRPSEPGAGGNDPGPRVACSTSTLLPASFFFPVRCTQPSDISWQHFCHLLNDPGPHRARGSSPRQFIPICRPFEFGAGGLSLAFTMTGCFGSFSFPKTFLKGPWLQ